MYLPIRGLMSNCCDLTLLDRCWQYGRTATTITIGRFISTPTSLFAKLFVTPAYRYRSSIMHCTMLAKLGRALVPLLKGRIETAWKAICPGVGRLPRI